MTPRMSIAEVDGGPGYIIGVIVMETYGIVAVSIIAVRFICFLFTRKRAQKNELKPKQTGENQQLQFKFIPGAMNWGQEFSASAYCRPIKDFSHNLKFRNVSGSQDVSDYIEVYRTGYFWKIDKSYLPSFTGNVIFISTEAPDFKPAKLSGRPYLTSMKIGGGREFVEGIFRGYKEYKPTKKIGDLNVGPTSKSDNSLYYRIDGDKRLSTLISCGVESCQHWFYKNGAMYSFDHNIDLINKSTQVEENLFNLFESFKAPTTDPTS